MAKLWAIAWRELYTRFTDRTLLIIMLAAPLGIATIVGLAFGGLGSGGSSPVEHIPVIVVNQDNGGPGSTVFGDVLTELLVHGERPASQSGPALDCAQGEGDQAGDGMSLDDLIDGQAFDEAAASAFVALGDIEAPQAGHGTQAYVLAAARAAVDRGLFTALVIVPSDYSQSLLALADTTLPGGTIEVEVYANRGRVLSAAIVRSVVDAISSQMASGNIAIGVGLSQLVEYQPQALAGLTEANVTSAFGCGFMPTTDLIELDSQPVQAAAQDNQAGAILVAVGSAQAMFFALFTAQFGILSVYEERKNWTLQRMLSTPTPRWAILGGKLVGVIVSILFQMLALMIALTAVGSLMVGHLNLIWGQDLGLLGLLLLAASTAVGGLGMLMAGVMRSVEQANVVASVLNIGLGVLGGGFGFQLPVVVAGFSLIHWGREAFQLLAAGQTEIWLHLAILFGQGIVFFVIGLLLFNRRFEV